MPLEEEPTVESLSRRIDELERVIRDIKTKLDTVAKPREALPVIPQIKITGSLAEKSESIYEIQNRQQKRFDQ